MFQEGCLLIWLKSDEYDPKIARPTTWAASLLRILHRHRFTRYFKHPITHQPVLLRDYVEAKDTYPAFDIDLDCLTDYERYLIVKRYLENVQVQELARLMGCADSTISRDIQKALLKLREYNQHLEEYL